MELQLNPENLGKVNLSVQSKNGVMTAQFVVQNETSKEAIESQLHTLRETLNQQGIKVEAIEVTVSTYAFEQNQESSNNQSEAPKEHSGRQISLEEAFNMSEVSEEENLAEDITGIRGSQIDYTA
jgi:flagellar hook-length control protein FliK